MMWKKVSYPVKTRILVDDTLQMTVVRTNWDDHIIKRFDGETLEGTTKRLRAWIHYDWAYNGPSIKNPKIDLCKSRVAIPPGFYPEAFFAGGAS